MSPSTSDLSTSAYARTAQTDLSDTFGSCEMPDPATRRAAILAVCAGARDACDALLILTALGLLEDD